MILRRLSRHLGSQNWVAVALDLLIEIVGVVLAFQVTEWNADRKTRAREHANLLRLQDEAVETIRYLEGQVEELDELRPTQARAVAALYDGTLSALDAGEARLGLGTLMFLPSLTPPRGTYDELAAAGALEEIRSHEVRAALSRYHAGLRFYEGQLGFFRTSSFNLGDYAGRGVGIAYDGEANEWQRFGLSLDLPTLQAQPDFMYEVTRGLRSQMVFLYLRRQLLEHAVAMCEAIAVETGTACPSDATPG